MIAIEEAAEWVPHGRGVVTAHPQFDTKDDLQLRLGVAGVTLLEEEGGSPGQEAWQLDEAGEELYCRDNTAVLSSGGHTRKCFTLSGPIHQALRCTFHTYPDRPQPLPQPLVSPDPVGAPLPSVCVHDGEVMKVFEDEGREFNVRLMFAVRRCWPTRFGLLVERAVVAGQDQLTDMGPSVLFCLLHPLDDYTRVVMKQGARMWEWRDQTSVIVHTSSEPSLVVTYNTATDTHSVWRVRRATQLEADKCQYLGGGGGGGGEVSGTPSSHSVMTPSRLQHSATTASPSQSRSLGTSTPFPSRPGTPGSVSRSQSRSHSPLSTMASMVRTGDRPGLHSPSLLSKVQARLSSPLRSPSPGPGPAKDLDSSIPYEDKPPLDVTLCLDHLWSEPGTPAGQQKEAKDKAAKVFLSTDLVGQQLICLVRSGPSPGLQMVKMEAANDNPDRIIFGAVRKVAALDAAPVSGLNMILVLDLTGSLVLYSGTSRVSRVLLPASPAALLSQEISALALDTGAASLDSAPVTPLNYKRSSLLTSSRPPSAALPTFGNLDSSVGFLSPVPNDPCTSITKLRDPRPLSCSLQYNNSRLVTVSLPPVAGSLVSLALAAIKQLLPRDLATLLHVTWYNDRHAPGPCPAPDKEWDMFCRTLLGLAGYQVDLLDLSSTSSCSAGGGGGPVPAKKCRPASDEAGCDGDWQQLLVSAHHSQVGDTVSRLLGLHHPLPAPDTASPASSGPLAQGGGAEVTSSASLFPFLPALLWSLHLLYEDCKLDTALHPHLAHLARLLAQLAADLQLPQYQHHYWADCPHAVPAPGAPRTSQLSPGLLAKLAPAPLMTPQPPSIICHLTSLCTGLPVAPFPLVAGVTSSCELLSTAMTLVTSPHPPLDSVLAVVPQPGRPLPPLASVPAAPQPHHRLALLLTRHGWDRARLASVPASVSVPLITALAHCQVAPPPGWPAETYLLIGREDLGFRPPSPPPHPAREVECPDGLEGLDSDVSRARWSQDQRLLETRRLLQSSRPVTVPVTQRPEVSDHEFVEEQEHYLKRLCERTMAVSVGRGVAGLRTVSALPTETLDIPRLCLTGRAPPRGAKVELSHIDVSHNMEHWPSFHNGVAAGLRLSTRPETTANIDSTWICFNKPKSGDNNADTEHAGFLMALGLNGHLNKLGKLESFDYLMKGKEAISIGILLGMAASKRGSMDILVTKKLSTQLEALLPPTATELPLSHNTQVAALMGVGLLYSGTGHRRMVELCLKELGKPPGPELENCVDRESYSLTAGLAMGMIMIGKGEQLIGGGLADLHLPSVLHNHMVGGPRHPGPGAARDRPQSYQIMEGDSINIDITSPGATLALAMMYWRSNNHNIASWMTVPETSFLLEFVRPDFLMLRTIGRGLILWDSVVPSLDWVEAHVPPDIRPHCLVRPPDTPPPGLENLDYETINQAYCNIIAGACFVLGLRFAGTWNAAAVAVLSRLTQKLHAVTKRSLADLTGRAVIEQTMCVLVLAQGMVMAGSGDLGVMRTCRMLRARVHNNNTVTYGSHMAVHLALGLLFLGGGKLGLANTPEAVAAMICAFYPKFPTHSSDNRYHLQALRHLYVLAVEPRVLVARSTDTGAIVRCGLELQYADSPHYRGLRLEVTAPFLLPSLSLLSSVSISDSSYWSTVFRTADSEGWAGLVTTLASGGDLAVKRKSGAGISPGLQWSLGGDQVARLGQAPGHVTTFLSVYLAGCPDHWVSSLRCLLSAALSSATPGLVPVWTALLAPHSRLDTAQQLQVAAQIRTLLGLARNSQGGNFVNPELAISLSQGTSKAMDQLAAEHGIPGRLREYLACGNTLLSSAQRQVVSSTLLLHSLPSPSEAKDEYKGLNTNRGQQNPLKLAKILKKSPNPASLYRIFTQ